VNDSEVKTSGVDERRDTLDGYLDLRDSCVDPREFLRDSCEEQRLFLEK
jgi:hypothetical protein